MATSEAWFFDAWNAIFCPHITLMQPNHHSLEVQKSSQKKSCQGTIKKSGKSVVRAYFLKIFEGLNLTLTTNPKKKKATWFGHGLPRCDMFHVWTIQGIEFPTPRCLRQSQGHCCWGIVCFGNQFFGCSAEACLVVASPACDEHVHCPKQCHGGSAIPAPNARNWGNCLDIYVSKNKRPNYLNCLSAQHHGCYSTNDTWCSCQVAKTLRVFCKQLQKNMPA